MREARVIRNEINGVKIFGNESFGVDTIASSNVYEKDKLFLHEIHDSNIHYSPVISLVGVNASGKTTALKLLSLTNELHLSGRSLNSTWINQMRGNVEGLLSSEIVLTSYISYRNDLIKIDSTIKQSSLLDQKNIYEVVEEKIWKKSFKNISKKELFTFKSSDYVTSKMDMEAKHVIVSNDISILKYFIKLSYANVLEQRSLVYDLTTLFDDYRGLLEHSIDENYAKYLDPSIDIIALKESDKDQYRFEFKKKSDSKSITTNIEGLNNILSAGTIRGLNIMSYVKNALVLGGMVFIDEIESHLNKAIIADIVKLFYSKQTNPFGAVLIFSSHYVELLDYVYRTDSIYILEKGKKGNLNKLLNFNSVIKRKDLKKSEAFISNSLDVSSVPQRKLMKSVELSILNRLKEVKEEI